MPEQTINNDLSPMFIEAVWLLTKIMGQKLTPAELVGFLADDPPEHIHACYLPELCKLRDEADRQGQFDIAAAFSAMIDRTQGEG